VHITSNPHQDIGIAKVFYVNTQLLIRDEKTIGGSNKKLN